MRVQNESIDDEFVLRFSGEEWTRSRAFFQERFPAVYSMNANHLACFVFNLYQCVITIILKSAVKRMHFEDAYASIGRKDKSGGLKEVSK